MQKFKNILAIISVASILVFTGCETTEKIDDFPLRPSQMVVNCFFNENIPFGFQVSKSLSVLDNADLKLINNAAVKLSKNGVLLETLTAQGEDGWYRSENQFPEAGAQYAIEVTAPDFEQVLSSEGLAPRKVDITEASIQVRDSSFSEWTDSRGKTYYYGNMEGSFNISIKDPGDTENYYALSIFFLDSVYDGYGVPPEQSLRRIGLMLSSEDASMENDGDVSTEMLFRDILFDGQSYQMKVDFRDYQARRDRLYYIELTSLQKAGYLYKKSIGDYYQARNDPFAEPVQIFGNIKNGYGIFSGFAVDRVEIGF
jgi:hypothetical protein